MLMSNNHKFIFIKSRKTAGSSVEAVLQDLCVPENTDIQNTTPELVTSDGIVGFRGKKRFRDYLPYFMPRYYNHMSANEIKKKVGINRFRSYSKISIVRNPFTKVESWFYFQCALKKIDLKNERVAKDYFNKFIKCYKLPVDADKYYVNGHLIVDHLLRFEHLDTDFKKLIEELNLPVTGVLPTKKSKQRRLYANDYDLWSEHSRDYIISKFSAEFELGGYQLR